MSIPVSPYVDSEKIARSEAKFRDSLQQVRDEYPTMPRDVLLATMHLRMLAELIPGQMAQVAVLATVLLVEEEAVSAKTLDNWDAMSEDRAEREAERYRLAWRNAAQRARNHLDALVDSDAQRDFLAAQLKERDDQVAQLVARLAEYTGITS